ncbi:MAG: CHAT domain-containing protein [Steroidobacteraceae bacterium]
MFKRIGHRVPRALRAMRAAALALAFIVPCHSFANACDPNMASQRAVYQATVRVRGQAPVKQLIPVSAPSQFMVFARERGVDITLELMDGAGHVLGRSDTPIRRTGVQRIEIAATAGQRLNAVLTGKDRRDSNGSVELRVVDLGRADSGICLGAQRLLAKADAAYAAGQSVTRAVGNIPGLSSDKAYQDAASGYREAAAGLQVAGASPLLAQAQLAEAALFNFDVDRFEESKAWAGQAAETYAALGDSYGKARAQAIGGAAALDIAVTVKRSATTDAAQQASAILEDARAQLNAAATFHASRGEFYEQAWAQNNIGLAFYYEGRYDEAIRAYQKALPLYERLHERTPQAQTLQNIALVEYELGRASDSLPHYRQALRLVGREANPKLVAAILVNSALAHQDSGNEDMALRELAESLALARTIQDTALQSIDMHHIASVYAKLGDQTRALDFYRQALALFNVTPNTRFRTGSLRAMANILRQQGRAAEALKMDREALSLAATPADRPRISIQIAKDLVELGRNKEAADTLETVLTPNAASDEVDRARALQERAHLRTSANDIAGAEADLKVALATFKTYELPMDEFAAWVSRAQLMRRRGAATEAFAAIDQALALAEAIRLQSANPELRSTLLQPLRPAFDLKIAMLSEQYIAAKGNTQEQELLAMRALETAEQARSRALADYQTLDVTAPGLDPALLERRKALYRELASHRVRLEARLDRTGTADSQSQAIHSEIASLRQEADRIDAKIGSASQTAQTRRLAKSTSLQLSNIPTGVAVIEYWLGTQDSFAWVVTRDGVTMTPIGASPRLNAEATALHTALRSFGSVSKAERLEAGERLYALVLRPIEAQITGKRTLIFAPDGALHYVPFATLRHTEAGRKVFLIQNHDIAVTPSIQLFLRPEPARSRSVDSRQMLLVDDPVYDPADPRVANSSPVPADTLQADGPALALVRGAGSGTYLPRLPGAAREAAAIASLMPPDSVDRLDGFAANRERFLASALERYRLIHVASHATTDAEIPQASALILSTVDAKGKQIDGRVLGADFMGVRLHADTVVLSACDTALGKSVAGEGLIGLQYAVLARGARSVVSSLWPAIDQVTAELMVKFYSTLLNQHSTVISAWSAASRAALEGAYADPGTWGAFMLTLSHVQDVHR